MMEVLEFRIKEKILVQVQWFETEKKWYAEVYNDDDAWSDVLSGHGNSPEAALANLVGVWYLQRKEYEPEEAR